MAGAEVLGLAHGTTSGRSCHICRKGAKPPCNTTIAPRYRSTNTSETITALAAAKVALGAAADNDISERTAAQAQPAAKAATKYFHTAPNTDPTLKSAGFPAYQNAGMISTQ